jgi:hypothetical protein
MSNIANLVTVINIMNTTPIPVTFDNKTGIENDTETETRSFSSSSSSEITFDIESVIYNQTFQVKHEGKYVDFIPYKTSFMTLSPTVINTYENLPDKVFGKFELNDKYNTVTVIYKTFKKKYIKVKKI